MGCDNDNSALGRFLSLDTLVPRPGDPQSLNRYAYVLNNPLRYTDPTGHWTEEELAATLGENWRALYFGKGAVFEGKENLLQFLLSEKTTSPVVLGILLWIMYPATLLHNSGVDLSGYDALGLRLTGTVGAGVFGGVTTDALLNINTGEFSLFGTAELGLLGGEAAGASMGWFAVSKLPSNSAYSGPAFAHGAVAGSYMFTSYEQFWGAPQSVDVAFLDMPHGGAITVGGGAGLGIYRSLGYAYEIYQLNTRGSQAWPPFDAGTALRELFTAFRVDLQQTPALPWLPRR